MIDVQICGCAGMQIRIIHLHIRTFAHPLILCIYLWYSKHSLFNKLNRRAAIA